jgi:macrolide transport system ATP-binding/permease protein
MERMARRHHEGASWLADAREAVASAWRTLFNNRFRALLTFLGIVIGIASVIVLMAVGQGASERWTGGIGNERLYCNSICY